MIRQSTPAPAPPGPHLRARERAFYHLGRALCALPPSVQSALAGGYVERRGQRLEPELLVLLRLTKLRRPPFHSPKYLRAQQNKGARIFGGPPENVRTRELVVPGGAGPLRARHYVSTEASAPLLVFLHGGGFVFGNVDTHDAPCRLLCRHAGLHVLSVEYRLAPEHPFPAAVEDARAGFRWAHTHARDLGADPARVAVGGDSAGANLAAVVAQLGAKDGGPAPSAQLLVYPAVDRRTAWASLDEFADGFYLTREIIDWFHTQYVEPPHRNRDTPDPRLNPLAADDLTGLAPALVVTAGFDPLCDEGEAYAAALARAGNSVQLRRFDSLVHGFFNMIGLSRACRNAVIEIALATRTLLGSKA
jgi:acetyl esterase